MCFLPIDPHTLQVYTLSTTYLICIDEEKILNVSFVFD